MFRASERVLWVTFLGMFLLSCRTPAPQQQAAEAEGDQMNTPLHSFSEDIQSPLKSLNMKPSEQVFVPITIRNSGQEPWSSAGEHPINVSYKWFDHGTMLPIEGERTPLPAVVKPDGSVPVRVRVVAPDSSGALILKISLVQEGVQWFMFAGAKPLEVPVTVQ